MKRNHSVKMTERSNTLKSLTSTLASRESIVSSSSLVIDEATHSKPDRKSIMNCPCEFEGVESYEESLS